MFTGLVETVGMLLQRRGKAGGAALRVSCRFPKNGVATGESVSVDGGCLTVTAAGAGWFEVEASPETVRRTTIGSYRRGRRVNLERPLAAGGRLGGHFVQGHIDATARLAAVRREGHSMVWRLETPAGLGPFVVEKGSVALDGVSLTASAVGRGWFEVTLIPHTLRTTTLSAKRPGDRLNMEVDVIAKYVEGLLAPRGDGGRP